MCAAVIEHFGHPVREPCLDDVGVTAVEGHHAWVGRLPAHDPLSVRGPHVGMSYLSSLGSILYAAVLDDEHHQYHHVDCHEEDDPVP